MGITGRHCTADRRGLQNRLVILAKTRGWFGKKGHYFPHDLAYTPAIGRRGHIRRAVQFSMRNSMSLIDRLYFIVQPAHWSMASSCGRISQYAWPMAM